MLVGQPYRVSPGPQLPAVCAGDLGAHPFQRKRTRGAPLAQCVCCVSATPSLRNIPLRLQHLPLGKGEEF